MNNPTPREMALVDAALKAAQMFISEAHLWLFCGHTNDSRRNRDTLENGMRSLDPAAIVASVILADSSLQEVDYEATFQHETTELVMAHIDRMNDICEQDTADRIIESFTRQFSPIFECYMAKKFPSSALLSSSKGKGT